MAAVAHGWHPPKSSGIDVPVKVAREFNQADKRRADMAKIRTPVIVVAGRLDRIAAVPAVKDGYRALGGPKEWLLITRANGAQGEYGHMDLVIGDRAPTEVWTKILGFFSGATSRK
jgi:poly(3-hydroxyalkanoate) synthetase